MRAARRILHILVIVTFVCAVVEWPVAMAQPPAAPDANYRVGEGDRIFMSVPQRPDLNRELVVKEGGAVTLPLIGEVLVGGQTAAEIEAKLLQALRDYYPSITRVQITITAAVSQMIYVTGQVRTPGRFAFPERVNVWEAIREAGGPLGTASLDNVRVIKDRSRGGTSMVVNVLAAIEGGSIEDLPELDPGDTVIVPTIDEVYTGAFGVNVFGAVVRPGIYRLQARQDLVSAMLLAGGPAATAELKGVKVIRPQSDGTTRTIKVDFGAYLHHGDPFANPALRPGDTIHVPQKSRLSQLATGDVGTILRLITAIATTTLLFIAIERESNR